MRKLYVFLLLFTVSLVFGQTKLVSNKIKDLNSKSEVFSSYNLFTKNENVLKSAKYLTSASDATVLNINSQTLSKIQEDAPEFISISVPYGNENVEVQLYKHEILTNNFKVIDESGNGFNYTPGLYYRGIVNGDYNSLVAISLFEDNVMGVISTLNHGNIVLGKSADKQDYVTYSDRNLLGENPYVCGFDDEEFEKKMLEQQLQNTSSTSSPNSENCVKIYYEVGFRPYTLNGSDLEATVDWLTGIQNNIDTLYENDDISVALNMIKIWTIDDPYDGDYGQNLDDFRQTVVDFEGDIAHLINYPTSTSVAYLDSLCTDYNYAYSGISMTYEQVPTYSWTIMAMTHEMGHGFGSPHTHACIWNGNNTAIDGCGPQAGYSEGCDGPIPAEGGTIMSYCHLNSVGINFLNGFGPQPAALIRNTIDSKPCLQTGCIEQDDYCNISIEELIVNPQADGSFQIEIIDETSTAWKYRAYPFGGEPTAWISTNSSNFEVNDLTNYVYHTLEVINVCEDGAVGREKTALLLPGNFCDETMFTDTGGESGAYGNNQHIIKTFYPSTPDEKVSIYFERIGLQSNQDFMYVYNGDVNNEDLLFDGGTITGGNNPGPSFISTHASGAITIEFISNETVSTYGWEAFINCSSLGIEEMADQNGITVYPNPTSDVLNIHSQKTSIDTIQITDTAGRLIMSTSFGSTKGTLNIGHLPKGVYFLNFKLNNQTITKKIIKK